MYLGRITQANQGPRVNASTQVRFGHHRDVVIVRLQHLQDLQDVLFVQVLQVNGGSNDLIACGEMKVRLFTRALISLEIQCHVAINATRTCR